MQPVCRIVESTKTTEIRMWWFKLSVLSFTFLPVASTFASSLCPGIEKEWSQSPGLFHSHMTCKWCEGRRVPLPLDSVTVQGWFASGHHGFRFCFPFLIVNRGRSVCWQHLEGPDACETFRFMDFEMVLCSSVGCSYVAWISQAETKKCKFSQLEEVDASFIFAALCCLKGCCSPLIWGHKGSLISETWKKPFAICCRSSSDANWGVHHNLEKKNSNLNVHNAAGLHTKFPVLIQDTLRVFTDVDL